MLRMPCHVAVLTKRDPRMKILAIDIGGTHVKVLLSGEETPRKFEFGPGLTAKKMVVRVKEITKEWNYDVVSLGYPGAVPRSRPVLEPHNLGGGRVGFDYQRAFGKPVKIINDAAMQALGSYKKGKLLFLGHLPYRKATYEDYVGIHGLETRGKRNGVVMLPTSCSVSWPRWNQMISFLVVATPKAEGASSPLSSGRPC
jgi:hypothetical protein